jgi:hypothetical protein
MKSVVPALAVVVALACGFGCRPAEPPVGERDRIDGEPTGMILQALPETIDPGARYLIYLHNRFLETAAEGDVHPTFGAYDFQAILAAFAERRFWVIAERREPGADPAAWATHVSAQVRRLQAAGVPAGRITVVGFSKGGAIAILACSEIADDRVNFVFIAACGDWIEAVSGLEPRGRLLSIREASDGLAGSCEPLFTRARAGAETSEVELRLGGGHGAFFRPRDEWIEPVVAWAAGGR